MPIINLLCGVNCLQRVYTDMQGDVETQKTRKEDKNKLHSFINGSLQFMLKHTAGQTTNHGCPAQMDI